MRVIDAARKPLAAIAPDATLRHAAKHMDEKAVGALLVLGESGRPVGIVTDRDIVVRAVAHGFPDDARVDSVMSTDPVTLDVEADIRSAFAVFRSHAIRRLPLTERGAVVAMLTIDDLFVDLVGELADLVRPVTGQVIFGHPEPKVPAPTQ